MEDANDSYEKDGSKFTFRHWLLEGGNLTSSLTVLSDLVLVAIYDETKDTGTPDTTNDLPGKGEVQDGVTQTSLSEDLVSELLDCGHCKEYTSEDGHTHDCYCDLVGSDPRAYDEHFEELGNCPYVKILRELYGEDNPTPKSATNDLKQTTMIEIGDIANLIKALFKVNIDIAHREYFLKIDVPEPSNWWYGYQDGDKWISFEPCVELKFSNLHSDNQLNEEGDLVCTVSNNVTKYPRKWNITPVNRELSYEETGNKCVQYNDFLYCYDYKQKWASTLATPLEVSTSSGGGHASGSAIKSGSETNNYETKVNLDDLDDTQSFYEITPLHIYQNTHL